MYKKFVSEGLRNGDLKNMISYKFSIDQFKSKIGVDQDILVLAFELKDKFSAIDAMEFIEKSYKFVLDADMSVGENIDGYYYVFVEIERSPDAIKEIEEILNGLKKLSGVDKWRFKYYKDTAGHEFTDKNAKEFIPLTQEDYNLYTEKFKISFISEMLNQDSTIVSKIYNDNKIVVERPYAQPLEFYVEDMGLHEQIIKKIKGAVQLDEQSVSEVLFLEKYLGKRDIHKINNKFIIQHGENSLVLSLRR